MNRAALRRFVLSIYAATTVAALSVTAFSSAMAGPAPAACYGFFPGAKGRACCDKSYAAVPEGAMKSKDRWSYLESCAGKPAKRN